ncbi:MAG: exodeoxyribonuclease III [Bdellovibrionales bacterium]|nr:exodeoxyribonuclease III [Bdellovibrionales bacterium]
MKIISWNVNGIRACARKGFVSFLEKEDPDILCIQESKAHPDDVDEELIRPLKRLSYWSFADRKGYSGTVTFVKKPVKTIQHGIGIKKFDYEGRFVITDHGDFLLFNVYFPNGSQTEKRHFFKQEFLKRFSSYLRSLINKGKKLIVLGDYNTAYLEWDVFDPKGLKNTSGFLPEERKWFQDFLSLGFIDCYRHFYPQKKEAYTWWSYRESARKNNKGWRIDHICVTSHLVNQLKSVDILSSQQGSDHCPIEIQLT